MASTRRTEESVQSSGTTRMSSRKPQAGAGPSTHSVCIALPTDAHQQSTTSSTYRLCELHLFLSKIEKGIFILGIELGFLVQGSTLPIQYITGSHKTDLKVKLIISLIWSYFVAGIALFIFFFCQKVVQAFLFELACNQVKDDQPFKESQQVLAHHPSQSTVSTTSHQHNESLGYLEDWKTNFQCNFVKGVVVGIFVSWICVDLILNFNTQVIYAGIVFLLSLLIFTGQIWIQQKELDKKMNQQKKEHSSPLHSGRHLESTAV